MFLQPTKPDDYIYDIETYPNIFTFTAIHIETNRNYYFELSARRFDLVELMNFIDHCGNHGCRWVGFNNIGFDYPVVHFIYTNAMEFNSDLHSTLCARDNIAKRIYDKAMSIIKSKSPFANVVWESDRIVEQVDLFKIHHFDNVSKFTSLKVLEFNMRMADIRDLPFDVGTELTHAEMDVLAEYNMHDCIATLLFYFQSLEQIVFREELTEKYNRNFINHNDTKIGKDFFIMKLEEALPGSCYQKGNGRRAVNQTPRESIKIADVIFPYIKFDEPEFNRILNHFKNQTITETKGVFKDLNCVVNGLKFKFGTGGIHASIESQIVYSTDERVIFDLDVASYYSNLAIANGLHPEHLGRLFCDIYKEVYNQRKSFKKGTAENAMLKLALNGVYGDSNNEYSPFYDPQYTMAITINGQLLLCVLAEALMKDPRIKVVQVNTDGITIDTPRDAMGFVNAVWHWWENLTGLELEGASYNRMFIRDVNNYIAEYEDGSLKRKGAYEYKREWYQNQSALIVPKAAEAALVKGKDVRQFIENHHDIFDFFLRAKVPRSSYLEHNGKRVGNIVRYYISDDGAPLEKVMPPAGPEGMFKRKAKITDSFYQEVLGEVGDAWDERIHTKNKSVYKERRIGVNTGWKVELCDSLPPIIADPDHIGRNGNDGADIWEYQQWRDSINLEWYIKEAEKLVNLLIE